MEFSEVDSGLAGRSAIGDPFSITGLTTTGAVRGSAKRGDMGGRVKDLGKALNSRRTGGSRDF
jgi:hypothetical protein